MILSWLWCGWKYLIKLWRNSWSRHWFFSCFRNLQHGRGQKHTEDISHAVLLLIILCNCWLRSWVSLNDPSGEHGVVVRAFGLYWGCIRFESLPTHHCWSLSKSFIPYLSDMVNDKKYTLLEKSENKKSNEKQTFVTLGQSFWNHSFKPSITWPLGCKYGTISLLWGDSIRKGAHLHKQNCLLGVRPPAVIGK